jgi:hypothetical protein
MTILDGMAFWFGAALAKALTVVVLFVLILWLASPRRR